jgi:hypothetical protein
MRFALSCLARPVRSSRRGASLLTILLLLCGIALVAALAIPAYFHSDGVTLDAAAKVLARDLRSLQNRAALQKGTLRMVFDADGWRALDADGKPVTAIGEATPIVRRFSSDGVFEGVTIDSVRMGDAKSPTGSELVVDSRGLTRHGGVMTMRFREDWVNVEIERGGGSLLLSGPGRDIVGDEGRVLYSPPPQDRPADQ